MKLESNLVDVEVATPAGHCDAFLAHVPGRGELPAVILFPDAFGLRPAIRGMAKRLAAQGYAVLVPNPFYRAGKSPADGMVFDFQDPADRSRFMELRAPMTHEAVAQDTAAFVAFLDAQPFVRRHGKVGVVGYCMGGVLAMQAAAGVPDRIGAGASFHGGGLATDAPNSPHRLVPKMRAPFYFGIAANDDEREPEAKSVLADAFAAAQLAATIVVYEDTLHGWCMPDLSERTGRPVYNEPQAERAWGELLALFQRAL